MMLLIAFVSVSTAMAQTEEKPQLNLVSEGQPKLVLAETEHDFGTITQGDVVSHTFKFVNEGKAPLIISSISTPCGCTTPKFPQNTPIAPGESGEIVVSFNSAHKSGPQPKTLVISHNGEEPISISITSYVNVPKVEPAVQPEQHPAEQPAKAQ
ncbi:MAG: DUF1573 domain-containing protein [Flavobacteriales bacterium]|nr:DUF1573 domain-containing protein [Flavobacteriales bacterium]